MTSLKRETAEEAEARLAKKLKKDRPPELKKKQFEINEEVKEKLTEAEAALSRTPAAVERARLRGAVPGPGVCRGLHERNALTVPSPGVCMRGTAVRGLHERSGAWPRRLHEMSSAWTRRGVVPGLGVCMRGTLLGPGVCMRGSRSGACSWPRGLHERI